MNTVETALGRKAQSGWLRVIERKGKGTLPSGLRKLPRKKSGRAMPVLQKSKKKKGRG